MWIQKRSESGSVCASDTPFGWSRKIFLDHPSNKNIYYGDVESRSTSLYSLDSIDLHWPNGVATFELLTINFH